MWDNPAALTLTTRLILALTILFALYMTGRQVAERTLPFSRVVVEGAHHAETRSAAPAIINRLIGGFFSLDLQGTRQGFEALPWVRSASVRRIWPDTLVIQVQEHVPAAAWNELAILNTHGEIFPVRPWSQLPRVTAPEGMEREVAQRYGEFARLLGPSEWRIRSIQVDARNAWQLQFEDGLQLDLGRERQAERLKRFLAFYPLAATQVTGIRRVDMRYPNGFAVLPGGNKT